MSLVLQAPNITVARAIEILGDLYGFSGKVSTFPSERDQNFLVQCDDGQSYVLKLANALESIDFLNAQNQMMAHLSETQLCPHVIPTRQGKLIDQIHEQGQSHYVRLLTYLNGRPLSTLHYHSPHLLRHIGQSLARIDNALTDFYHPAFHREFHWDLGQSNLEVGELPKSVIHNDANDGNVIVVKDGIEQSMVGLIDFGDAVYSWTVANLAVGIAYAVLDKTDPLKVARMMVEAYHNERPLTETEIEALFALICRRLHLSVQIAQKQMSERPDDPYLAISQGPIQRTLPTLKRIPPRFATAAFRHACGLPAVPQSRSIIEWIQKQDCVKPVGDDNDSFSVVDLSVGSLHYQPGDGIDVGRYLEPRLLYHSAQFATGESWSAERRTIHLGADLGTTEGTPVVAPLEGVVHAMKDIQLERDYGPVIILRHETDSGGTFYTLYGHLSQASLERVKVGDKLQKGQQFAWLGSESENGGWPPHVHFQLMIDLLDLDCDFPGVCKASEQEVWEQISPNPNLLLNIENATYHSPRETTQTKRAKHLGSNLSLAYQTPLSIVRGSMQYLYDETGRQFLDAYNNVPHVGHCHPHVVEAAHRQMQLLSTNTRYLHENLANYTEKLASTMPQPLEVCYLLSSASEANEIALRLARAYTGARNLIVMEGAYHGCTTTMIDVSPYKHDGPGGEGAPEWVHVAPLPDSYRSPQTADSILDLLSSMCGELCGFLAETCPSVGGQIMLPEGYLKQVYHHIRSAGGVCIADEVQTGFGRLGHHFYAFEREQVVPDIVVMGKPIGNGYPLAAVVTTREIADAFDNGMELFSTFGGSTVSCAVGLAVLEVLEREDHQANAREVGDYLLKELQRLKSEHPLIGDVRGSGFFLGVELVRDHQSLEPSDVETSFVVHRMCELGVLVGTDGLYHNVIKIRPPMPFNRSDADILLDALDQSLLALR